MQILLTDSNTTQLQKAGKLKKNTSVSLNSLEIKFPVFFSQNLFIKIFCGDASDCRDDFQCAKLPNYKTYPEPL